MWKDDRQGCENSEGDREMSISWRDKAILTIADCLLEYEAQCACLGESMDPKTARQYCNERYPFGMRQYSPYTAWLEELRLVKVFIEAKLPAIAYQSWRSRIDSKGKRRGGAKPKTIPVSEGQLSLLG